MTTKLAKARTTMYRSIKGQKDMRRTNRALARENKALRELAIELYERVGFAVTEAELMEEIKREMSK